MFPVDETDDRRFDALFEDDLRFPATPGKSPTWPKESAPSFLRAPAKKASGFLRKMLTSMKPDIEKDNLVRETSSDSSANEVDAPSKLKRKRSVNEVSERDDPLPYSPNRVNMAARRKTWAVSDINAGKKFPERTSMALNVMDRGKKAKLLVADRKSVEAAKGEGLARRLFSRRLK